MLSVSIRSTAIALGVAMASPLPVLFDASAQVTSVAVDARAVSNLSGMFSQYLAAATGGQFDEADRLADELVRASAGTKLNALKAAIDQGQVDRSKLLPLLANPATEEAATRLELRLLDAMALPIQSDYNDFAHFTRIARPDLAQAYANKLAQNADPLVLLHAVENSRHGSQPIYDAMKIGALQAPAEQLASMLESAQLSRAAEPDRIRGNIRRLSQGSTAYNASLNRLRAAGSSAAPFLLEALQDQDRIAEQPDIRKAMIDLGRPMVLPLSAALSGVENQAAADLAYILGQIGYPEAAPAIQARLEAGNMSAQTQGILTSALSGLLNDLDLTADAGLSTVALTVGERYYAAGTRGETLGGVDDASGQGQLWGWNGQTITSLTVPAEIYADVLALKMALQALEANGSNDQALSLFLKSNFRRENRLPQGATDRSYPQSMAAASFYATMSGSGRLLDVLDTALTDGDSELALDAIAALQQTTATSVLAEAGPNQPLLRALNDVNRQVRFDAALALAGSRPTAAFAGDQRVVPVLAEAVREGTGLTALVIADNQDQANALSAAAEAAGMTALTAKSINEGNELLANTPGANLVLTAGALSDIGFVAEATAGDYRLASVPVVALVADSEAELASSMADTNARLTAVTQDGLADALAESKAQGMDQGAADAYAMASLDQLLVIALSSDVLDINDAVPALIAALGDDRGAVATAAGDVLVTLQAPKAQRALADAAVATDGPLKVAFLLDVAQSATQFGNQLTDKQVKAIAGLIASDDAELAQAASIAHGALALPTASVVDLLTK